MDVKEYEIEKERVKNYEELQAKMEQMNQNAIYVHQGVLEITASYQAKVDIKGCQNEISDTLENYFKEKQCHYEKLQSEI